MMYFPLFYMLESYVSNHSWKYKLKSNILLLKILTPNLHLRVRQYILPFNNKELHWIDNISVTYLCPLRYKTASQWLWCLNQFNHVPVLSNFILISSSSMLSIAICNIFCAIRVGAKSCILQNTGGFYFTRNVLNQEDM